MLSRRSDAGFALFYTLLGAFYIVLFRSGLLDLRLPMLAEPLVKTVPIWLLLGLAVWRARLHAGGLFLILGLFLGSCGDFVLSAPWIQGNFLIGLAFFFVGHLFYAMAFFRSFRYRLSRLILIVLVAIGMAGLIAVIYPHLHGDLTVPVLAYIAVIFLMNFAAAFRSSVFLGVFAGAVVFLVSDSLIALSRFVQMDIWEPSIMITYYMAQFLIVMGSISDAEIESMDRSLALPQNN